MRMSPEPETLSLTALLALTALPAAADNCAPLDSQFGVNYAQEFTLSGDISSGALQDAMSMWNNKCGNHIPKFKTTGSGIPITVHVDPGINTLPAGPTCDTCGCAILGFTGPLDDSTLVSGTIYVFGKRPDGSICNNPTQIYAHELGHLLGFENGTCNNRIMGPSLSSSTTVTSADCNAVDEMWMTPVEEQTSGPSEPDPDQPTPLILDLDHDDRVSTTGINHPVWFDFIPDGTDEQITWTSWEREEGFLWLDLNENGAVDDGSELFGSSTILPSGKHAENGFEALAVYDTPERGGNADGIISDLDRVWRRLRLWVDWNHDGASQRNELATLGERMVIGISLDYVTSDMVDGAGNGHFLQGLFVTRSDALGFPTRRYQILHDIFFRFVEE
jgi:hypothetical protein